MLITGTTSGVGLNAVKSLVDRGWNVVTANRDPVRAAEAAERLGIPSAPLTHLRIDLGDLDSVRAGVETLVASLPRPLDALVINAAVYKPRLKQPERSPQGYEISMATNHLGHFQLTARLWPLLKAAGGARLVSVSSIGHRLNGLSIDDPNFEHRDYDKWLAYGQAKSANALFALHLDKLGAGSGVRAFAVHPGGIVTPLQRHLTMDEQKAMGWFDEAGTVNPLFKTTEEGAATAVWCATSPLLDGMGGVYCEDCNIGAMAGDPPPRASGVWPHIRDEALAAALWDKSEQLTGVAFRP